jgi:hypothetical protein
MKTTISTLVFLLYALLLKAQLFSEASLYPNTTGIHGKYFNGSGGKGYWTYEKLDSFGRTVEKNSYKNKEILAKDLYQYNDKHDITYIIHAYSINRPQMVDTFKYEYAYLNNRIAFQKCKFANNDSITYRLIADQGDSVFTYQEISYYQQGKKANHSFERTYILTYQGSLLVKKEVITDDKNKKITSFEYYTNGKLKRRTITREPESDPRGVYTGGPGGDDQFYRYTYDSEGRIKHYYTIVANKTYKVATYSYEN